MSPDEPAERASDFINAIGVNTHISYYNTAYVNETAVVSGLQYLGIDHVRDSAPIVADEDYWVPYEQDMAAGIRFDLVIPQNAMNIPAVIATLHALETDDPGGIDAVEGINEGTSAATFASLTGEAAINAFQGQLMAAVHGDPLLAGVQVYSYTLNSFNAAAFTQFGDISAESDDANAHVYFGYYAPSVILPWFLPLQLGGTPNHPFVVTETGYDTMPGEDSDGSQGVNDDVQAKYTLDDILDLMTAGASMVYIYELLDETPDRNMTDHEQHFGLFNNDGTPKESAVAVHDVTTILADRGATASSFTTGTLGYTLSNLPSTGNSMLLEKSDGWFYLAVWAEPPIWNPTTLQEIIVAATPVTISLAETAGSVEVYDPLGGTAPIATYTDVSQITVGITDHPLIIEIDPVSEPILTGVAPIQTVSGTVAPFSGLNVGDAAAQDSAIVTLSSTTHGVFGNLGIGSWSAQSGVYRAGGTPAQVAAALQALTFTPTGDCTTSLSLVVTNSAGTASFATSVIDPAPLSMPVLSDIPATQSAAASVTPFGTLVLTDAVASDSASITLSTTSQGALGKFGIGRYSAVAGSYSVNGTPSQVAAALQGLTYTPNAGSSMAYTTIFTLTISNQDGTGLAATSILGSQLLPKPILSGLPATQAASGPITPFGTLEVADLATLESAYVTLSSPAEGALGNLGTGSYSAATGIYRIVAAPAAAAAAIRSLTFTPAVSDPVVAAVTFTVGAGNRSGFNSVVTNVTEVNQSLLPIPSGEIPIVLLWATGAPAASVPVAGAFNEAVVAGASGTILAPGGVQSVLLGGTKAVQLSDGGQAGIVLAANQGTDVLEATVSGDLLIGGSGNDSFVVSGGDTVRAGSGTISISSSGANRLQLGAGTAIVRSTGGDAIFAGSGAATISAGTGDAVVAGTGTLTFIGGAGTTTFTDPYGSVLLTAPSQVAISGSTGTIDAAGGMAQKIVLTGGGTRTVDAGNGAETIDASGSIGANLLVAGGGTDQIIGGTGSTVIVAGGGNDTMNGAGPTQFEFINGAVGGEDVITGFNPTQDGIVLQGFAAAAVASLCQAAQRIHGSTMLQLSASTSITLAGVAEVSTGWFTTSLH